MYLLFIKHGLTKQACISSVVQKEKHKSLSELEEKVGLLSLLGKSILCLKSNIAKGFFSGLFFLFEEITIDEFHFRFDLVQSVSLSDPNFNEAKYTKLYFGMGKCIKNGRI